jgi:hypothetical protein
MIDRLRLLLSELRRSERGIALPMALMVTVVGMGLAAVPIVASVNSQGGNQHNQGANEALAAAEAGAEVALREQGTMHLSKGTGQLCVSTTTNTAGWCPQEPRSGSTVTPATVGLATYTYRVLPCYGVGANYSGCSTVASTAGCTKDPIQVVATGTAQVAGLPVERRVSVSGCAGSFTLPPNYSEEKQRLESELTKLEEELKTLEGPRKPKEEERTKLETERIKLEEVIRQETAENKPKTETKTTTTYKTVEREVPPAVFSGGQVVGIEGLVMNNDAQVYNGGVGTNGAVSLTGSANVCGTVRYGKGFTKTANNGSENPPSYCKTGRTFIESAPVSYPPVSLPPEIATRNSNSRLTGADPANGYNRGNVSWNESKRELTLNYGELTLEGSLPYYLCKLVLAGGGVLRSGAGKSIRFFFDEPRNCPGLNGSAQLQIANGTTVLADAKSGPGFYFLGSSTAGESKIELGGGANVSQFLVYAPRSKIVANNGVNLFGAIIGQSLELGGGADINEKGSYTPPTSTEFVAPEKIKEEVPETTTSEGLSPRGEHEEQKRILDEQITKLTKEIESINGTQIEQKKTQIVNKSNEVREWNEKANPESNGGSNTSFQKSGFSECSATPPAGQTSPSAGC